MTPRDVCPIISNGTTARDREVTSELLLAATPCAVSRARRHTHATLCGWQLAGDLAWTVELLVSELVTNAVRCIRPGDLAGIVLRLRHLPHHLVIEVTDPDPRPPVLAAADPEADGGRGLILVDALSTLWSYFRRPAGGKTVFCVFELKEPPLSSVAVLRTATVHGSAPDGQA